MIINIQILRFAAAFWVAFYHSSNFISNQADIWALPKFLRFIQHAGFIGVDIFFVISGVIMALTTKNMTNTPHDSISFIKIRFTRIYTGWWPIFAIYWGSAIYNNALNGKGFWSSLLLLPVAHANYITPVLWTLSFELYFYIIVGIGLLAPKAWRIRIFQITLIGLLFFTIWSIQNDYFTPAREGEAWPIQGFFFSPLIGEFLAGFLIYEWIQKKKLTNSAPWLAGALFMFSLAVFYEINFAAARGAHLAGFFGTPMRALLIGGFSVFLVGAALISKPWLGRTGKVLGKLGDASYAIYLCHLIVMSAAASVLYAGGWPSRFFAPTLVALLSIVLTFSWFYYAWIERPFYLWVRKKMGVRAKRKEQAHIATNYHSLQATDNTRWTRTAVFTMCWLSVLSAVALTRIEPRMEQIVSSDAQHRYLPYARQLLDEGIAFLWSAESVRVAPLSYIWPAIFGGNSASIRSANVALFLICLVLLWRIGLRLGGLPAAMASTLLMVLHPELHHYFPTELTEPIFLFGAFLWIFGIVRIGEQPFQPNKYIALAAIGLMLTLLVKPVLQVICLLILITTLIIWLWPQNNQKKDNSIARQFARAIALSTTFALLPAAGVALKNGILFGVWGIATGSGAALYLGVHPLSIGTEPAYFGLTYDVSKLALMVPGTDGDHLHPAADSLLKAVALDFLKNMTIEDAVIYFGRKLWWWAFDFPGTKLRTFRALEWLVLLLGAAYTALCWLRSRSATVAGEATNRRKLPAAVIQPKIRFIILVGLGIILTGMLVQLQVVLYNSRYSVVAVEPWLLILTGVSAAALMRPWRTFLRRDSATVTLGVRLRLMSGKPRVLYAASMALLLAGPSAFIHWTKHYENLELDPQHLGPVTSVFSTDESINIVSDGMTRITTDLWRMDTSPAALIIPAAGPFSWPALSTNDIWLLNFSVSTSAPMNCRFAELAYTQPQVTETHSIPRLAIRADARAHAYAVHANRELRPAGPGSMRIAFHCPIGTTVQWDRMQLLSSDTVTMAARHIPLTKSVEPSSANTAR